MFKKPNFIQRIFICKFLHNYDTLISKALARCYYVVIDLYLNKFLYCIHFDEVDDEIKHLEQYFKLCVVNNIIFVW